MSVTTKADEKIEEAKDHLTNAYKALLVVLDENTWGHDDLSNDYVDTAHEMAAEILKIRRRL